MPASTVFVQDRQGNPVKGKGCALGFTSGQTKTVYTGSDGRAVIEHSSVGQATVYVDGRRKDSGYAPGKFAVTLS